MNLAISSEEERSEQIMSYWEYKLALWNKEKNEFENCSSREEHKFITMKIELAPSGHKILRFLNAPTGFESYRLEDLLREEKRPSQFFICAGTVNSWPSCWVLWEEVEDFLREEGEINVLPSS